MFYDGKRGVSLHRLLVVIDMQNDFVSGSLGTEEAGKIVPAVVEKVKDYLQRGDDVLFTRDTHGTDYLHTQEGRKLPVEHCLFQTWGWEIIDELKPYVQKSFDKPTFGSLELTAYVAEKGYQDIELAGLCTDICVVSNALLLKANLLEAEIAVDSACCAGVTPETHKAALTTMEMCQVRII